MVELSTESNTEDDARWFLGMLQRFDKEQQGNLVTFATRHQTVPAFLHHYTTIDGVQGIIESGSLWASDVGFMNDSSELSYSTALINEVVVATFAEVDDPELKALLPTTVRATSLFDRKTRPLITSFCEDGNLLSQWRAYGPGAASASLGFDLSFAAHPTRLPANTYLRKVLYDEAEQRDIVQAIVASWLATVRAIRAESDPVVNELPKATAWLLKILLADCHLSFKHPSFAEENEWRLIHIVDFDEELEFIASRRDETEPPKQRRVFFLDMFKELIGNRGADEIAASQLELKFRPSPMGFVPYCEIPLQDDNGLFPGGLPLLIAMQGPSTNTLLAHDSLAMYLHSKGYGFVDVSTSDIPLRY